MTWLGNILGLKAPKRPYFYNTLSKSKQEFTLPRYARVVRMYNCGPTVYNTSHIGNLRSYVFADIVRRTLEYNGFSVKQAINITDFGHLSSDSDSGQDKMSTALKREGLMLTIENMRILADRYIAEFYRDLRRLNIDTERILFPRASDYVEGEKAMILTLKEKGYAYTGTDGVYFDTSRFPTYGKLGDIDIAGLREGARVVAAEDKKNPSDFLLWKRDERMGWEAPWGRGFPGWHIECSAMINATLGKQIDIHTGGIDLMPTHHNNEIAQSESATGKRPFSRFWLHHEFLNIQDEKISKSTGNVINLPALLEKGFHPLSLRYLFLSAHYRSPLNFTWQSLDAAQTSFLKLRRLVDAEAGNGRPPLAWQNKIDERLNDDIDTPGALAAMWEMTKDRKLSRADIRACILRADKVFGLGLNQSDELAEKLCRRIFGVPVALADIPKRIQMIVEAREGARREEKWEQADSLRKDLQEMNYIVEDTPEGPRLFKKQQGTI